MKTTSPRKQLLFRMCSAKSHFNMSYIDKGLFVIIYETKCNLPMQNVMAYESAKVKMDFKLWRVKLQRKIPEGK